MAEISRRAFVAGSTALAGTLAVAPSGAIAAAPLVRKFTDPLLNQPYIDVDEWRDTPSRHRYVHGGFTGTDAKFQLLFPPKQQYQGRFFQHNTAIPTSELLAGNIWDGKFGGFCFDSGGIAVVTNQGGFNNVPQAGSNAIDPTIGSYRVAAATAMYVRELAQKMYGPHRTYGYAFGGSGGGYRTLAGAENTSAWDGVVPYIHGNAHAWPNSYAGRARAQRVLKDKMPQIADALEPGGGDVGQIAWRSDQEIDAYLASGSAYLRPEMLEHLQKTIPLIRRRGFSMAAEGAGLHKLIKATVISPEHREEEDISSAITSAGTISAGEFQMLDWDEARDVGVNYVAAPVFSPEGEVCLEIVMSGFPDNLGRQALERYTARLVQAADVVTSEIRGRKPKPW